MLPLVRIKIVGTAPRYPGLCWIHGLVLMKLLRSFFVLD